MSTAAAKQGAHGSDGSRSAHVISGVPTAITAFVGRAQRGPVNQPIAVATFADYTRAFGGLWQEGPMSFAVRQFFENGGAQALIVRVHKGAATASLDFAAPRGGAQHLTLVASSRGSWGGGLVASVTYGPPALRAPLFNLTLEHTTTGEKEVFLELSTSRTSPRYVRDVLDRDSMLARVQGTVPASRPAQCSTLHFTAAPNADGDAVTAAETLTGTRLTAAKEGIYALDKADLFNILCIPPYGPASDVAAADFRAATAYCRTRRAILLADPPATADTEAETIAFAAALGNDANVAFYFPRVIASNSLQGNESIAFPPCGAVAGVIARTDATRGVWKAPAGTDATLNGVSGLTARLNDAENGRLNALGINCLREFPPSRRVVWGSRTLAGADGGAQEYKYLPVRRLALYIEESVLRGTTWAANEANGEPLWSALRLAVGAFLQTLFQQGAFQGSTPREAYFVKCDAATTSQADIAAHVVNFLVGFAPMRPAEFTMLKLHQRTG